MQKTTKALPPSIVIPKKIKTAAKIIEFVSKKAAVKFSYKIFTTPVNFKIPERESYFDKSAKKERLYVDSIDREIEVITYGYSPKNVLLVHGWSGRATQFFMLANKLLENGFMVTAFSGPAHGNSDGKNSNLYEFIEASKQVTKKYGPFYSVIGHSLGAIATYNLANHIKVNSAVGIGGADTITDVTKRFAANMELTQKTGILLKQYLDEIFRKDVDVFSSARQAKTINIPVLVVHDKQDGDVPVTCAENIAKNLKNGTLIITEGFGHTKILRDENTMDQIVEFVKKH